MRKLFLSVIFVIFLSSLPVTSVLSMDVLHMFGDGPDDGANPYGSLTLTSDGRLYGMTSAGGTYSAGVIFSINLDGSNYKLLRHFGSTPIDGSSPRGSLTEIDGRLYGMTSAGGTYSSGVIFGIDLEGSNYALLHLFGSAPDDGVTPVGSPTFIDSVFYGMTSEGGAYGGGTIFSVKPDGSDYDVLYHFGSAADDGVAPSGSPTFIDSLLCGMTSEGGTYDGGTIFSIKLDGTDYSSTSFGPTPDEPVIPIGSLTIGPGGRNFAFLGDGAFVAKPGFGVFLSVGSPTGEGFEWSSWLAIHTFWGAPDDGALPSGSPTYADGVLYGMTNQGGNSDFGTIFSITPNGYGYNLFHHFGGAPDDGASPFGSLTYVDGRLYGMTNIGGSSDFGVIFSIDAVATGVKDFAAPQTCVLYQNVPNPFNPVTVIRFSIAEAGWVRLVVFDVSGRVIRTLVDEKKTAGTYSIIWDGKNDDGQEVASSIFFYELDVDNFRAAKKIVILR